MEQLLLFFAIKNYFAGGTLIERLVKDGIIITTLVKITIC